MPTQAARNQVLGLAGWLCLAFVTAAIGSAASVEAGSFYRELVRPDWAPPGWLFGPVWSFLYLTMGIAAWLVWRKHGWRGASPALWLFVIQLAANALWSWLFFFWRLGGPSFAELILLWLLVAGTVAAFWRLQRIAAALLLPYLAWVSFAGVLNYTIWQLNPAMLG